MTTCTACFRIRFMGIRRNEKLPLSEHPYLWAPLPNSLSFPTAPAYLHRVLHDYLCFDEFFSFSQFQLFWDKTTLLVILQPIVIVCQFRDSRLQRLHSILVQIIPSKTLLCSTLQQIQLFKMPEVYISQSML